jgi:hypothetical protein
MTRARPARSLPRPASASLLERGEKGLAAGLLVLHAVLALWVARENSVTFDENFHVPAGVRILRAADFETSYAQPPLPKTLYGIAALAAGARDPDPAQAGPGRERFVGYTFMRANADRYQRVYGAARLVAIAFSLTLGAMIWRTARRVYGARAGLVALALWTVLPEALAHGSIAGVDLPTGLTTFGVALSWCAFLRTCTWKAWTFVALWIAAAFLTRFSSIQLLPAVLGVTAAATWRKQVTDPRRVWIGLALLPVVALAAIDLGYLLQVSLRPLSAWTFQSETFKGVQQAAPWLRLPLPDAWLGGVDYVSLLAQPGAKHSYLFGEVRLRHSWAYFPVAIAVKWPLGLLAGIAWSTVSRLRERRPLELEELAMIAFPAVILFSCVAANLDQGVRYALPILPFAIVGAARLAAPRRPGEGALRPVLVLAMVAAVAVESARALPYPLAFFNTLGGGPGRGDRIVNSADVDWGQGLVALRRDLERLGIRKVHLAYHGTVDPALYGIDYEIYTGGEPGPESNWLAVSSYFFVGLPARLTTMRGMSESAVSYDFAELRRREPAARSGYCMYLFRLR